MNPDAKEDEWTATKRAWGDEWDAKRDIMLGDFATVVRSAHIACVGAVVDAAHFRKLSETDAKFKEHFQDPVYAAFHTLVMRGIEKTEIIDMYSPISLVVDDDQEYSLGCYRYLNQLKMNFPKVRDRIQGMCIVNDKSYSTVQVADMVAYESRRLMVERKRCPGTAMSEMYKALTLYGTHRPRFYTPEILDELRKLANSDKGVETW